MTGELTRRGWVALVAVCMGFFVIQLDATIVNVALPAIGHALGGSVGGLQWVVDAYTLPLAAFLLTAGSRADRLGARRLFVIGLAVFGAASAVCAAAPTLAVLVGARAVQGAGAAALLPSSLALIVHQFADAGARARALGVWGGVAAVGLCAGPLLGGGLVSLVGWRGIFVVNVPICALVAGLIARWVDETPRQHGARTDLVGTALGAAALAGLSGGFIEAGHLGWTAALPLMLLGAGAAMGAAFVAWEARHPAPMLPLAIFRTRAFSAAVAVGVLFNLCLYGALLCLALFLQRGQGQSPAQAGLTILPLTLAVGVGATLSGRLTARFGPRAPMLAGTSCGAAGAALLSSGGPDASLALVVAGATVLGFCSLAMPAMTSVAVGVVEPARAGLASGVLNAGRQTGGALGVALLGALLASSQGPSLDVPLKVAAGCYVLAVVLSWLTRAGAARPRRFQ